VKFLFKLFLIISISTNLFADRAVDFIPESNYHEIAIAIDDEESFDDDFIEDEDTAIEKCPSLEDYNRFMTEHNDYLYTNIITPISNGYEKITNKPVRDSIGNFFYNLAFPIRFVNNILQVKLINAGEEIAVFTINTTIGLLGIFKPAQSYFGLQTHKEDFGQTLGYYGVSSGCHIVLPFFGPSNTRDIIGMSVNTNFDILYDDHQDILTNDYQTASIKLFEKLNDSPKSLKDYQHIKEDAIDLYPYMRDMYEQYRDQQIKE
jgi:phospholipid-binding lipoprotein MlaA